MAAGCYNSATVSGSDGSACMVSEKANTTKDRQFHKYFSKHPVEIWGVLLYDKGKSVQEEKMSVFLDFMKVLKTNGSKEYMIECSKYAIKTIQGDAESLEQLIKMLSNAPAFYKNNMFIMKLQNFLLGTCTEESYYRDLSDIIADGDQTANAERILDCLDALETERKVTYVVNATRSWIRFHRGMAGINKGQYFRVLYIIKNILLEDIEFLTDKIKLGEVSDSDSCVALESLGLMYITTSDKEVKYAFSPLAYIFYEEVIRGDDEELSKVEEPSEFPMKMDMGTKIVEF